MPIRHRFLRCAIAAFVVLTSAIPTTAMTLREVEVACPIDGTRFKHRVMASYTQFGVRLDMRPHGAMMSPPPLPVCPGNGFVVYRNDFTPAETEKLKSIVATAEYRELRQTHVDYFMLAYFESKLGGADRWKLANIYLRAAWQGEGGDAARHREYLVLARDNFVAAAETLEKNSANYFTALLLVAELERQLGRFEAAKAALDRLADAPFPEKPPLRAVHAQIGKAVAEGDSKPRNFAAK